MKNWMEEQKKFYDNTINKITNRDSLASELKRYIFSANVRATIPKTSNEKIFFKRRYLEEKEERLICLDSLNAKEVILFSTKSLDNNGKYSIDYLKPSFDGKFVIIGISESGDEMSTMYIIDVDKKILLKENIRRVTYAHPQWLPDNSGFFYNQLKEIKTESDKATMYENSKLLLHKIGDDPSSDKVYFSKTLYPNIPFEKIAFPFFYTFPNSSKVLAVISPGATEYYEIYYAELNEVLNLSPGSIKWKNVNTIKDKVTCFALSENNLFLIGYNTNPNGRVEKIELTEEGKRETILDGKNFVLRDMLQNKNAFYIKYLKDGIHGLIKFNLGDLSQKEIPMPFAGSISLTSSADVYLHSDELYIGIDGWNKEWGIYCYDNKKIIHTNLRPKGKLGEFNDIVSLEVKVKSHDGTLVPLSIIYSKKAKLNGKSPTILYAYGSHGQTITPFFDYGNLAWFNKGGIYAVAHVRGGGENGAEWYKGGFKSTKPNSWKDFIACGEYLISNKYTSSENLAAVGESGGAVTIGRAITERPELFKASIISVGVLNVVRFENTINTLNTVEYGTVKDSLDFQNIYNMDVYHHIKDGVKYPSMLFTAVLNDSRVEAWQPAKAVARFQKVSNGKNLILFRINGFGHFGSGDEQEIADDYSFLLWQLCHPDYRYVEK